MLALEAESFWRATVIAVVTMSFSKCRSGETSYQMLEVLAFCTRERLQPSSIKVTVLISWMKKKHN